MNINLNKEMEDQRTRDDFTRLQEALKNDHFIAGPDDADPSDNRKIRIARSGATQFTLEWYDPRDKVWRTLA